MTRESKHDPVSNPSHYTEGRRIETIEAIEDWDLGHHLGSAVKYISRAGRKGDSMIEDLEKAVWYLNRRIEIERRTSLEGRDGRNDPFETPMFASTRDQ
tara:strand:- start:3868 stop:4164 length:297 start_codon:yes stop_codon:yes gene_type:complete